MFENCVDRSPSAITMLFKCVRYFDGNFMHDQSGGIEILVQVCSPTDSEFLSVRDLITAVYKRIKNCVVSGNARVFKV